MRLDITLTLKSGGTVRFVAEWEPVDATLADCAFILGVLTRFRDYTAIAMGVEAPEPAVTATEGKP